MYNKMFSGLWFFILTIGILLLILYFSKNSVTLREIIKTISHDDAKRDLGKEEKCYDIHNSETKEKRAMIEEDEVKLKLRVKKAIERKLKIIMKRIDKSKDGPLSCCDYYDADSKVGLVFQRECDCIWPNVVDKNEENFKRRIKEKKDKISECKSNNVRFFIIPYHLRDDMVIRFIENY